MLSKNKFTIPGIIRFKNFNFFFNNEKSDSFLIGHSFF